jgi:hypothetical protein
VPVAVFAFMWAFFSICFRARTGAAKAGQPTRSGRLTAVAAPAALDAVTLHCTLRPRSLRVTRSALPVAPFLLLPATSQA